MIASVVNPVRGASLIATVQAAPAVTAAPSEPPGEEQHEGDPEDTARCR